MILWLTNIMKYFKNTTKNTFIIILLYLFTSCEQKEILIKGNVNNLPDGIMYLCKDNNLNKIDSVETKNGKFMFKQHLENEPIYLTLHHIDKNKIFRIFHFLQMLNIRNFHTIHLYFYQIQVYQLMDY